MPRPPPVTTYEGLTGPTLTAAARRPHASGRTGTHAGQVVQDEPLRVKAVGIALVPEKVPWKPKAVLPPGLIVPLYARLAALTFGPLCVSAAFQKLVTFWSPAYAQVSVQPLIAVAPTLVIVTLAVNPPDHSLPLTYPTLQPSAGGGAVVTVSGADAADGLPAKSCARTTNVYAVAADSPVTANDSPVPPP